MSFNGSCAVVDWFKSVLVPHLRHCAVYASHRQSKRSSLGGFQMKELEAWQREGEIKVQN